jgi:hypothetical protein
MPTVMFNYEQIKKTGVLFSDKVGPKFDLYFWFQLAAKGAKFALLPDILYLYRIHSGQLSNWYIYSLKLDIVVYSEFYHNEKIRKLIEERSIYYSNFFQLNFFKYRKLYLKYRSQRLVKSINLITISKILMKKVVKRFYSKKKEINQ